MAKQTDQLLLLEKTHLVVYYQERQKGNRTIID